MKQVNLHKKDGFYAERIREYEELPTVLSLISLISSKDKLSTG